jgi:hypothetical protein
VFGSHFIKLTFLHSYYDSVLLQQEIFPQPFFNISDFCSLTKLQPGKPHPIFVLSVWNSCWLDLFVILLVCNRVTVVVILRSFYHFNIFCIDIIIISPIIFIYILQNFRLKFIIASWENLKF